jgi:hypothetical protein
MDDESRSWMSVDLLNSKTKSQQRRLGWTFAQKLEASASKNLSEEFDPGSD